MGHLLVTLHLLVLHCDQDPISSHFGDTGLKILLGHDLDLPRSADVISHVTIRLPMTHFHLTPRTAFPFAPPLGPDSYLHPFLGILGPKDNWVTTLTCQGHVTSSVM